MREISKEVLIGLAVIWISLFVWIFRFFPLIGHDGSFYVPGVYELKLAWQHFGAWNIDYSPFRCLGLPLLANPSSFAMSIFHGFGILFPILTSLYLSCAVILSFAFFGTVQLAERYGASRKISVWMSIAWCLQGWCFCHTVSGHLSYLQLALLPWFFHVFTEPPKKIPLIAAAFWIGHLYYTSGFYILLLGIPSLIVAAGTHAILTKNEQSFKIEWKRFFGGLAFCVALGTLAALPKLEGILRFTANFPRVSGLANIGFYKGLLFSLAQDFYPIPFDVFRVVRWPYGNWESYLFLVPGAAFSAIGALIHYRKRLPSLRFLAVWAIIVFAGALLCSGVLAPIQAKLPLVRSLRTNPRWFGVVLLPYWIFLVCLWRRVNAIEPPGPAHANAAIYWITLALISAYPLLFLDRSTFVVNYKPGLGINTSLSRISYCYEPIFGDHLETFPGLKAEQTPDFLYDPLRDPRCYLAPGGCASTSIVPLTPGSPDERALSEFRMRDEDPVLRFSEWICFPVYSLLALAAMAALIDLTALFRDSGRNQLRDPQRKA